MMMKYNHLRKNSYLMRMPKDTSLTKPKKSKINKKNIKCMKTKEIMETTSNTINKIWRIHNMYKGQSKHLRPKKR